MMGALCSNRETMRMTGTIVCVGSGQGRGQEKLSRRTKLKSSKGRHGTIHRENLGTVSHSHTGSVWLSNLLK